MPSIIETEFAFNEETNLEPNTTVIEEFRQHRYPLKERRPCIQLKNHFVLLAEHFGPQDFEQVIKKNWILAIQNEVDSLTKNGTWTIVDFLKEIKMDI